MVFGFWALDLGFQFLQKTKDLRPKTQDQGPQTQGKEHA
jgi:hypothetical protein